MRAVATHCLLSTVAIGAAGCAQSSGGGLDAERLIARIDEVIEVGTLQGYRDLCEPLHPRVHETRLAWLERAVAEGPWAIESEILDFTSNDEFAIALVTSTYRATGRADDDAGLETTRYVAFRGTGDATRVVLDIDVFLAELPEHPLSQAKSSRFGCRACNYVIRADAGWLLVPHLPARSGVLEAISLYSLAHSASVDLSIHVAPGDSQPENLLAAVLRSRGIDETTIAGIHPWVPPSYRDDAPRGLAGARADLGAVDGWSACLHAVRFGPIVYLMTVEGTADDLDEHAREVEGVLAGFMLRETDPVAVAKSVRPVERHTGGGLDGTRYTNDRLGIALEGPPGWEPALRCGPHLCHVAFTCPEAEARLSLRALAPPFGRTRWSRTTADWTISNGLGELSPRADSGWRLDARGERTRDLRARDGARWRSIRAILPANGERLYLLDARCPSEQTLVDLEAYFDSFER